MTRPGGVARADRLVDLATRSATVCQRRRTLPSCSAWRSSIDRPMADPDRRLSSAGGDGEAGIGTIDWLPADELAEVILRPLLAERPAGVARARVLVNGLGSTKYEELFVLYGSIRRRLADAGIELVDPEVGEFVTSLDMAGCSLTLCWLDAESERLLAAPALSPGFRMARLDPTALEPTSSMAQHSAAQPLAAAAPRPSTPTTSLARVIALAIGAMADAIKELEVELGQLDSLAGDGDHGAGMARGMTAAATAAASSGPGGADVLKAAALAFSDAAGGASGALWGVGLLAASEAVAAARGPIREDLEEAPDIAGLQPVLAAALAAIMRLGGAVPGDKTMVDALAPFVTEFGVSVERSVIDAWTAAAAAAERAAAATANLASRKGRAAIHGDRSRGTPDPGAVSMAAALTAAGKVRLGDGTATGREADRT